MGERTKRHEREKWPNKDMSDITRPILCVADISGRDITPNPILACRIMLACFISFSLSQADVHSVAIMSLSSDVFTPNSTGSVEQV